MSPESYALFNNAISGIIVLLVMGTIYTPVSYTHLTLPTTPYV